MDKMNKDQSAEARLSHETKEETLDEQFARLKERVDRDLRIMRETHPAAIAATPDKPSASDEEIARDVAKRHYGLIPEPYQRILARRLLAQDILAAIQAARTAPSEARIRELEGYEQIVKDVRQSIACFCPADDNIEERTTLDALNVVFRHCLERKAAAAPSEDTKRLDWLIETGNYGYLDHDNYTEPLIPSHSVRSAIDAAMNAATK